MKHIKHLLLLLLVLTLVGCKPDPLPEKLSTPSNVLFEELLTWDEVEHATGYDVYINNTPHHSDQNY